MVYFLYKESVRYLLEAGKLRLLDEDCLRICREAILVPSQLDVDAVAEFIDILLHFGRQLPLS